MVRFIIFGMLFVWQFLSISDAFSSPLTFERRLWGRSEGAPQAAYGIAQDADGMLWFPTATGLWKFDGAHFTQTSSVYGHALLSTNIVSAVATHDGLAIGYQYGGVSVFTHDAVRHYSVKDGLPLGTPTLFKDKSGSLYVVTYAAGIARFDAKSGMWTEVLDAAMRKKVIQWADFDDEDTMWIATSHHVYARRRGEPSILEVSPIIENSSPTIVGGKLMALTGPVQLTKFSLNAPPVVLKVSVGDKLKDSPFEGPDGTLWAWLKGGTTFLHANKQSLRIAQTFEGGEQSGKMVMRWLLDRENNLWVTTPEGVERYRRHRLNVLPPPAGELDFHVGRGLADEMLVTSREGSPVRRLSDGRMETLAERDGVSTIYRQNANIVWFGGSDGLARHTSTGISRWPLPDELHGKLVVQSIAADRAGAILVSIVRNGVYRFLDGKWTKLLLAEGSDIDTPICMLTGATGRTYLGYTQGRLAELTTTGISMIKPRLTESVGNILSMVEHDGKLLVGGERGVVWLHDGSAHPLKPQDTSAFLGVSGMAISDDGSLWMHGAAGLFRIPSRELARFFSDAVPTLDSELFNFEDGLRGQVSQIRPLPSLSLGNDGNIYYATSSQVGWINPTSIRRNARAPTVLITALKADQKNVSIKPEMVFPAGTTNLEIQFTATALSIPERVRFRYRLLDVDKGWQQAGMERSARYTNLGPGSYSFQVIAANEDGVWNSTGTTLQFHVTPMLQQTYWFRALITIALLSITWILYRWRIATIARRSAERTATRLEERERIARNLHDNLLQGVQALIVSCHVILMRMPAGTSEEKKLSKALDRADQMIEETRDELMGLRGESSYLHLGHRLKHTIAAMESSVGTKVDLKLSGFIEHLDCRAATEIFYVLQEAITNCIKHAGARHILVVVDATETGVHSAVTDDGCGMRRDVIEKGRFGHWGLKGMRERVSRLGGTLTIESEIGGGTSVKLSVPADIAFTTTGA